VNLQLLPGDLTDTNLLVFRAVCGDGGKEHCHDDLTSPFLPGAIPKLHRAADLATLVEATQANNLCLVYFFLSFC